MQNSSFLEVLCVVSPRTSASLVLSTPAAEGIVVCADRRGVKSDGTEVESTKLFIVNPRLVFGGTGDTEYFSGNRPIFDVFNAADQYLRGVEHQEQVHGLGRFLQTEFRSFVSGVHLSTVVRPFQIIVFYVDQEHTPYLYLAKLTHQLDDSVILSEEHRGGNGTAFFLMASLGFLGEGRLIEELKSGRDVSFDDLRRNKPLMELISLRRTANSVTSQEASAMLQLLIRETSKRIDRHLVSEDSQCVFLPYDGAAAWK